MKRFVSLIPTLFLLSSTYAHAGVATAEGPLLVKTSQTGFITPQWSRKETCEVYADRLVIRREFGAKADLVSEETRQTTLKGDYQGLLSAASEGKIVTEGMSIIDGPSYEYTGFIRDGRATKSVTLKSENGANASLLTNSAVEAQLLLNVLDSVCPKAFE